MSLRPGMRRVLVTGGGSGIGRAVAEALLRQGAKVALVGRRRARLEEVAAAWPGRAEVVPADLAHPEEVEGLLDRARERLGGLDGLVCAAGVAFHQLPGAIEEAALRQQIEVNLVAPLRLGEAALHALEPGGGVVFVASNLAHRPLSTSAVYSATKAGLLAAMRALARAGTARAIRFNAVSPGIVDTEMVRELRLAPGKPPPTGAEAARRLAAQLESLRAEVPLGRLGTPEEIAEAVVFLLGAPWATGVDWILDGGGLL
ncbi:MAG TPA: SDR family oxidoreductase [Fredinandcohnia sp.]|nr:SDR family oxidoreductase [Fredinandcohnia sp.]